MLIHLPSENAAEQGSERRLHYLHCGKDDERNPAPQKRRILIVEDELFVALDLEQLIEDLGHESVGIARDAEEAIELASRLEPDCILMDVNLGSGRSGTEAAREILARRSCRLVFVTAYRDPANLARINEVSPEAAVLNKPVAVEQLREIFAQSTS